jgi:hypothetical protein
MSVMTIHVSYQVKQWRAEQRANGSITTVETPADAVAAVDLVKDQR